MLKLFLLIITTATCLYAQEKNEQNIWEPFEFFTGSWKGHETGKSGIGKGERMYEFIMDGKYFYQKNTSTFEPQEKNPEGEVHEDRVVFSYDKNRKVFVAREFNIEGFVNQYVLANLSQDYKTFVFISESIENAPPGTMARLTYKIENENEFVETFELSFAGKEFSEFLKNYWKRK